MNKNILISMGLLLIFLFTFTVSNITYASSLTRNQIQTIIINLLEAFGVDTKTIASVRSFLEVATINNNDNNSNRNPNTEPLCTLKYGTGFTRLAYRFGTNVNSEDACRASCNAYGETVANNLDTKVACTWDGDVISYYNPKYPSCVNLSKNMHLGSTDENTGGEVSKLQRFLAGTGDYTYGRMTGYYGFVTMRAVQKYQCRVMGICAGSIYTNGYGVVDSQTRKAMSCKNNPQSIQINRNTDSVYRCGDILVKHFDEQGKSFVITNIRKNQKVNTPLYVKVKIREGKWTAFEGTAGEVALYVNENKIAETQLHATYESMFANAVLDFDPAKYDDQKAKLVLKNENPSGLPDKSVKIEIPIVISKDAAVCEYYYGNTQNHAPFNIRNTDINGTDNSGNVNFAVANSTYIQVKNDAYLITPEGGVPMTSVVTFETNVYGYEHDNKLFIDFGDGVRLEIMAEGATCKNYCKFRKYKDGYAIIVNGRIPLRHIYKHPGIYTVKIVNEDGELAHPNLQAKVRVYGVK